MATIKGVLNTYEAKLNQGGLTEPLSTYLADPVMTEKLAAGFTAIVTAASTGALATAYPAATYPGLFANVGAAAPYALYWSTGALWKAVTIS
jgi:hypothetical protein